MIAAREQAALNDQVAKIALPQHVGPPAANCWNGEAWVVIRGDAATSEGAIAHWLAQMDAYAAGKAGAIYWRHPPEIACQIDFATDRPCWLVYSRLLICAEPDDATATSNIAA